ncbi:hypothetical protein ColTof3_13388 [Colletotrichum tofieldiae]|nr:hypothetical protein ColTof3_13388 [Colletotrichum tofieldiae]
MEASISITHTCLAYLTSMEDDQFHIMTKRFPLARYAAEIWMDHVRLVECVDEVVAATVNFLMNTTTFRMWGRVYQPERPWAEGFYTLQPSCVYFACFKGLTETAKHLILRGAEVNGQGGYYGTALQAASFEGHKKIVQMLLDNGADVNTEGGRHRTALEAASLKGHKEIVQILLGKGASVNAKYSRRSTALQAASSRGHKEIVQMLLADMNIQDSDCRSAFQAAFSKGHKEVANALLETKKVRLR